MIKTFRGGRIRCAILIVGLLGIAACTAAEYSDGISGFSQAVTTAANLGQPLATAAQQAAQNEALRALVKNDSTKISISNGC
jgi:hypothetical protein